MTVPGQALFDRWAELYGEAALRQAIRQMAAQLEPGGLLIVEPALTPERLQPPRTSTLDFECGGARVRRTTTARHEADLLRIRFDYRIQNGHRVARRIEEQPIPLFTDGGYRSAFRAFRGSGESRIARRARRGTLPARERP